MALQADDAQLWRVETRADERECVCTKYEKKLPRQKTKSPGDRSTGLFVFNAWQCPTFTWGDPTLSSALCVFTSEFGMDSGGTHTLWPPGKLAV